MNLGIIGTGAIASLHMNTWKGLPDLHYAAVCSRSREKGAAFAEAYGIPAVYTDYSELLADQSVDTVYIALPNHLHYEYAEKALLRHKNAIVEKPFTSNLRECDALTELSRRQHVFLWEAMTSIHLPVYRQMQSLVGQLGKIKLAQFNYCRYSYHIEKVLAGGSYHAFSLACSGGVLMDVNVYNLYLAVGLFGLPNEAHYYANKLPDGADSSGCAVLTYPDFICLCTAAEDVEGPLLSVISGTEGTLYMDSNATRAEKLRVEKKGFETVYPVVNELDSHACHMAEYLRQLRENDYESCQRLLHRTREISALLTELRQSAGITFPADCE